MGTSQSKSKVTSTSRVVNGPGVPGAESARRVLDVMLAFTKDRHTLSAKDLADLTGIPLPSVYRYVALLRDAGLLVGNNQGNYCLSTRFTALSRAAEAADYLIEIAHGTIEGLAQTTGETVLLARMINGTPVCVHRIESSHKLRFSFEPGEPLPLDRGATSRILLESISDRDRAIFFAGLRTRDPDRAAILAAEVADAARRGWAVASEELDEGIWAVSAGIRSAHGDISAALTLTAPLFRTAEDAKQRLIGLVCEAASEISSLLLNPGAQVP